MEREKTVVDTTPTGSVQCIQLPDRTYAVVRFARPVFFTDLLGKALEMYEAAVALRRIPSHAR